MRKVTLDEQKTIMLEILLYIDQIASFHNLRYSLWGGTMLGAVRHKGFIPWDDDIDISLPREDYEKLLSILKSNSRYSLYEYSLQTDYTWGWAKLTHTRTIDNKKKYFNTASSHGIFVDIVPIDGLPNKNKDIKVLKRKLHRLNLLVKTSQFPSYASSIHLKRSIEKLLLLFPLCAYSKVTGGKKKHIKELNRLSKSFTIRDSNKCGHLLSRYKKNLGYPSSIWDKIDDYEFEGHLFKGISDSHTYLSLLYGEDYMEIPSKDKQIIHEEHAFYRVDGEADEYCYDNGKWSGSANGPEYS
ncbi:LicD family protein [Alkalibacterium olivapovliticus]|uniref:Lipopolysaccharide cholinephosphotransferase n=1 Tax=Alkalibacterium olivapovliticus TaxID=99907 RepID=A0A2T0W6Y5_9LACT|nr:LicD family protein [Alkalibacterium olivapovliticus]PRY82468.1 lipopolysaccharide cholinephosphotransferase [Alkalibacterium olivapovliticus]